MPATLGALAVAAILIPGYVHRVARSRQTPLSPASQLNELLALLMVSLVAIAVVVGLHEVLRLIWPGLFIDTIAFLRQPSDYWLMHFGGVTRTVLLVLIAASFLAGWLGNMDWPLTELLRDSGDRLPRPLVWVASVGGRFAPVIVEASAWHRAFDHDVPEGCWVMAGCSLKDGGGFVSGRLGWYSTDTEEHGNRGLELAPPFEWVRNGKTLDTSNTGRIVLSASDIAVLEVLYRSDAPPD